MNIESLFLYVSYLVLQLFEDLKRMWNCYYKNIKKILTKDLIQIAN